MGPAFWVVWSASTVSYAGDGLTIGAMPLLALSLTDDPRLISAVDALLALGWLLLGLLSGVVVDRVDRLGVMWRMDGARAVMMAALTAAIVAAVVSMPLLLGLSLLLGLVSPFFDNASSSVLPELVPERLLEPANSWTQAPMLVASNLIGPPLGALLFTLSHGAPFLLDAVSFGVAAVLLWSLARRRTVRTTGYAAEPAAGRAWDLLREGMAYLLGHPTLRLLALAVGAINLVTGGVFAVLVLYVTRALALPEAAYGWFAAMFAVGGVVGSVLTPRITAAVGARGATTGSLLVFGLVTTVLGAAPWLPVVVPAVVLAGLASVVWNVVTISYRQRVVPPALLGRVTSSYRMIAFLGIPVGALGAGVLTHALGVTRTFLLAGLALLAAGLVFLPLLRRMPGRPGAAAGPGPRSAP